MKPRIRPVGREFELRFAVTPDARRVSIDARRARRALWIAAGGVPVLFVAMFLAVRAAQAVTPVTPLGIPVCDAFLTAYAQCANGPGVPETARPGLRQAINLTRESLRSSAVASERARRTVEVQCAQNHALIRRRLVEAYGCEFPEPSLEAKALATWERAGRP